MATIKKTSKDENVKKLTKDKFAKLKYLSAWLFKPELNPQFLIEDRREFDTSIKYKLFSYFLDNPKVCWYLNEYLNGFYNFVSNLYEPKDWLYTFSEIIKVSKVKRLWITKFQNLKRDQFTKLLDDYCKVIGEMELNNSEINNLYLLFEHNIIDSNFIEQLQLSISDKGDTKSKSKDVNTIIEDIPIDNSIISPEVVEFCGKVVANITNRNQCRYCPGYKKGNLVLDAPQQTDLDILIIGLYPDSDDIRSQKTLSNNLTFKLNLKTLLDKYKLTYGFSNRILCEPINSDDSQIKKMYECCNGFSTFVHDVTKPKIRIILGSKYAKLLGVKSISKNFGNSILDGNSFLLPDPSEINLNKDKDFKLISTCFENLDKYISFKMNNLKPNGITNFDSVDLNNQLTTKTNNYTLFDIQVIQGKVIYTVLDEYGEKQYIENNIVFPVYIKQGKFNECDFISEEMDFVANLSIFEKQMLSQKLNENLKKKILKSSTNTTEDFDDIEEPPIFDDDMF